MTLNNIKKLKDERGFTIVELLIVIVVIGILAAIIIVAYQGVTARANTAKAQTNAVSIQKKAEAYNADSAFGNGLYPATVTTATTGWIALSNTNPSMLGAIPSGITVLAADPTSANATSAVRYTSCSASAAGPATGYYIDYWDSSQGKLIYLTGGANVVPGANNTIAPTCSNPSTT